MMSRRYHTVVIGGGILGVASAVALQRRLGKSGERVLLIEKRTLGAGLSSRHSGIVRSAHRSAQVAAWAARSTMMWQQLEEFWGVPQAVESKDSLWIAPADSADHWSELSQRLQNVGIQFDAISNQEAGARANGLLAIDDNEAVFLEKNCLLVDPGSLRETMAEALIENDIDYLTQTAVVGLEREANGSIREVHTTNGAFKCSHVVNAAGAWSPRLFDNIAPDSGIEIPVGMERVFCANFLAEPTPALNDLPLVADYQHNVYFRNWPGAQLHMHSPRSRDSKSIASAIEASNRGDIQDDAIYSSSSLRPSWINSSDYASKLRSRFTGIGTPTQASGEFCFFDVTPDLGFILGPDSVIPNLHHNLGAGEAMKFSPALGEVIADSVLEQTTRASQALLDTYSIDRFRSRRDTQTSTPAVKGAL